MEHTNPNPKQKPKRMSKRFSDGQTSPLQSALVLHGAEYGIRFFLGAILSSGTLLGSCMPFGLGFLGASGSGLSGLCALLGCCFGYLMALPFSASLKYIAASILIFAVSFAFYDVRLYQRPWFMPVSVGLLTAVTGFIFLAEQGIPFDATVRFATEILLAASAAYCYQIAFSAWTEQRETPSRIQSLSFLLLCISVLAMLSHVLIPGGISVGRIAAAFLVMLAARFGGVGRGSTMGVVVGVAMDLAANAVPMYTMAFGFSGLMAGAVAKWGRLAAAAAYILSNGAAVLWALGGVSLSILYEVFIASVLFLLLPERVLLRAGGRLSIAEETEPESEPVPVRTYLKEQLESAAAAFRDLYDGIRTSFQPSRSNEHDVAVVFDRAASRACRNCPMYNACWQRGYAATFDSLSMASKSMLERGRAEASDFPPAFAKQCMRFPSFLAATNEELTALFYRKQYRNRLLESRMAVCHQYEDLAGILDQTVAQLDHRLHADAQHTKKLNQFLKDLGLDAESRVFFDAGDHLRVEVEGAGLHVLESDEMQARLSDLVGIPLRPPGRKAGPRERLVWTELEPLAAVIGMAARQKNPSSVSGDNAAYFKTDEGMLYIILADGMGSGDAAARESKLAIRLLERFLRAGIYPEPALKTLNSALILRSDAEGGFTTLDLLQINLFTGQADLYKFGAAPSYCFQKQRVRRISGNAMPVGLSTGDVPAPDIAHLHVEEQDLLVLVSDGIVGSGEDQWLRALIAEHHPDEAPRNLARRIVEASTALVGAEDDKTAMVVAVQTRVAPETPPTEK